MLARLPSPLIADGPSATLHRHPMLLSHLPRVPFPMEKPTCILEGWSRAGRLCQVGISIGLTPVVEGLEGNGLSSNELCGGFALPATCLESE